MNQIDIITRKRDGQELSADELQFLISQYVSGNIPDYQISAFLMAVYFNGMTPVETATFTRLMRDSGTVLNHSAVDGFKSDKHSTGGVGDKVSLILAPLVASAGVIVPMISGRGLAHTGGTLDKLEAIPGFRTNLDLDELEPQLNAIGVVMIGQTEDLCPADKKIYALRDATATVNSIPLITASILSKKLAEGIDSLVLDVKAGSGAIFEDKEKAWELAKMLTATADNFGLKTTAILTSMEQPLGRAVGNWLETREAIDTLRGNGPADLLDITLILSAQMLLHSGKVDSISAGMALLEEKIASGEAFDKFLQIVKWHGGDTAMVEKPDAYPTAKCSADIVAQSDGHVAEINCREIGRTAMALGAGRTSVEEDVDYTSGIMLRKKVGDAVRKGEPLATAYSNDADVLSTCQQRIEQAFKISSTQVARPPLIFSRIEAGVEQRWDADARNFV